MKILLVEDSKFLRVATERALTTAGYQVISASDGEQASRLAPLREHMPEPSSGSDTAIDSIAIATPPVCLEPEDPAGTSSTDCGERSTPFRRKGTPSGCGPRHGPANLAQIFRTPTRSDLSRVAVNPVHSIRWTWLCH